MVMRLERQFWDRSDGHITRGKYLWYGFDDSPGQQATAETRVRSQSCGYAVYVYDFCNTWHEWR